MLMRYLRLGVGHTSLQAYQVQLEQNIGVFNEDISQFSFTQSILANEEIENVFKCFQSRYLARRCEFQLPRKTH